MLITTVRKRRLIYLGCALMCVCISIVAGGVHTSKLQSQSTNGSNVVYKTQALQVESWERKGDGRFHLVVKNVGVKNLNGYVIAVDGAQISVDISSGDRVISHGSTDELQLSTRSATPNLTILAAMFADGSIEGDPTTVEEARRERSELKTQLTRGLSLLNQELNSPDVDSALDSLESRFSALSVQPGTGTRRVGGGGLHDGRDSLLSDIHLLRARQQRNGNLNQRRRLLEWRERIKRRIANL